MLVARRFTLLSFKALLVVSCHRRGHGFSAHAGVYRERETADMQAKFSQKAFCQLPVGCLQRAAKLLARSFEKPVICPR